MTARYKPGSRVQAVWEVFEQDGATRAHEHGLTLGLTESTLRGWINRKGLWAIPDKGAKKPPRATEPPAAKAKGGATPAPNKAVPTYAAVKERVCWKDDPRSQGTMVQRGVQQSVVKWDNGNTSIIVNEWVVPATMERASDTRNSISPTVPPARRTPRVDGTPKPRRKRKSSSS